MPTGNIVADDYIDDPDRTAAEMQVAFNELFDYVRSQVAELSVLSRQEFRECAVRDPGELIPEGVITMWSGSVATIPTGWALCDGTNGTPDLRSRFIVGAGSTYDPGDTGGASQVTLTQGQMPSHSHSASASSAGTHQHSSPFRGALSGAAEIRPGGCWQSFGYVSISSGVTVDATGSAYSRALPKVSSDGTHNHSVSVSSAGSGQAHENRPPYYALAFIMRLAWS